MPEEPEPEVLVSPQSPPDLTLDDIIGLSDQVSEIEQTLIESAIGSAPTDYRMMSLMIYGPMGSGKRRLARAIAGELGGHGYAYEQIESLSSMHQQPSEMITSLFEEGADHQPIILLLDCFDDFFSSDAVRTFESRIKKARQNGDQVFVITVVDEEQMHGTISEYIQAVDVVLEVEQPDIDRRHGILSDRFDDVSDEVTGIKAEDYDINRLARETDRFGVNNLDAVVRRAVLTAQTEVGVEPPVTEDDIVEIISQVDRERIEKIRDEATLTDVNVPNITFDDVAGHERAKRILKEQLQQSATQSELTESVGGSFGGGILLHGPPGTGKTMLVRALANELDHTFIPVNGPALKAGRGGPAAQIPMLFYRAQRNAPAILFFDEFDSLGTHRGIPHTDGSAVNTLLTELDGVESLDGIMVIAATNRPKTLDPALLRPGRFDYHIEIGYPDTETQAEIFATHTDELPLAANVTPAWFGEMTDSVTGADIVAICERAVTIANREQDGVEATDLKFTQSTFEKAYTEFKRGRLYAENLDSSPAFQ